MKFQRVVLGIALSLLAGSATAGEGFSALAGIPAQALSQDEMEGVQGKWYPFYPVYVSPFGLLGSQGALPFSSLGIANWAHQAISGTYDPFFSSNGYIYAAAGFNPFFPPLLPPLGGICPSGLFSPNC